MSNIPVLVVGSLTVLLGLVMMVWPRRFWHTTEGWKYDNPQDTRLSDAYVALIIAQGVGVIVIGVLFLASALGYLPGFLPRAR